MKAVVVEDEILIREGLCRLMQKMFPDIAIEGVAGNGQEGLQYIERYQPDLVITDIKMPGMDGLEMLGKVQEAGLFPKVIVLTAYSEFEYAKQAVKLGVCDYIIKPVVVQEFVQTIRKVQNLCEQEQKRTPETMGSLEHIVSGLLYGVSVLDEKIEEFLEKKYQIARNTPLIELLIYMGDCFAKGREKKQQEMRRLLERRDVRYCLVDMEYDKAILALLYGYPSRQEIERWYQNQILFQRRREQERHISYGMVEVIGARAVREGYQTLLPYMDWNIVLGDDVLISYPKIEDVQTDVCIYPVDLENQIKVAICTGEEEKIRGIIERFHAYFLDGKVYSPKEIKESYVRFQWAVLNIAKEVGESFSIYIRNYRLSKAKELLIGTQLKQYEIAEKVGYADAKYFARVFKECVGMSPAEYRKSNR